MNEVVEVCPNRIKVVQRYTECSVESAKLTLSHLDRMESDEYSGADTGDGETGDEGKRSKREKAYVRFDDWEGVLRRDFQESGFTNRQIESLADSVVKALQERFAGKCLYLPKVDKVHVPNIR